jgi:hypothetical protein
MKEVIIPEEQFVMGQPVAVTIMKFLGEHGLENGLIPSPNKKMKVEMDEMEFEFHQYQNFNPRKGMRLKIFQEE